MFLDDIGDAIVDTVKTVGEGVGNVAKEAFSTVLSPAESILMGGLGTAASTVSSVFGGVDIFDSALDGAKAIGSGVLGAAGTVLSLEMSLAKGILGDKMPPSPDELGSSLTDLFDHQTKRDDVASQQYNGWKSSELNPQPLPPKAKDFSLSTAVSNGQEFINDRFKGIEFHQPRPNQDKYTDLNPQPLPPHPDDSYASEIRGTRGRMESLNPQPLPPHPDDSYGEISRTKGRVESTQLNPQPLPPHPDEKFGRAATELNPQPLPPHPDEMMNHKAQVLEQAVNHKKQIDLMTEMKSAGRRSSELNPQPLPPQPDDLSRMASKLNSAKINRAFNRFM